MTNPQHNESSEAGDVAAGHVRIFDTTLRDGEQTPGFSMDRRAKLRMAQMLEALGVDVLEAGFPAASPDDFAAVAQIAGLLKTTTACALARCVPGDIDGAGRALENAQRSRIHVFLSTSPLHREHKLGMSRQQVLDAAVAGVERAVRLAHEVEFSAEDAMRTEPEFLAEVFSAAAAAGATTLNAPDTVGYLTPAEIAERFAYLIANVKRGRRVVFSSHCHNDLGLAVANSLAAVGAGARQVECTINGLGERAGNCSLEEVVMAVKTRKDYFNLQVGIDTTQILAASKLVSSTTGFVVQPNKAVVGANAFAHASGIHQDGVLKARDTYEIMRAEDVGWSANKIVLGKLSGRNAFKQRLQELGVELDSEAETLAAFSRFKELADRKSEIFDEDILALVNTGVRPAEYEQYGFVSLSQHSETGERPKADIVFTAGGKEVRSSAEGNGPVDASLRAIEAHVKSGAEMTLYSVNAINGSTDAQGEVTVRLQSGGHVVNGSGADPDIIVASAKAYLSALNRLYHGGDRVAAQG